MRIHSAKAQRWYRQVSVELLIILRVAILLSLTAIGPMAECGIHYGWILGTLAGGADPSYNLISYAYDTTPGVEIPTGFTGAAAVPEPSTLVLGALASLVLGAA